MCVCVYIYIYKYILIAVATEGASCCSVTKLCLTLQPHGWQLPCPSPSPGVCSDSCPVSRWCYLKISSSALPSIFPNIRVFASVLALCIRWPKYWNFSFSISPSSKYSGLISFRIDWFDLLAVQRTLKSSPAPQFESINSSALSPSYSHMSHGVLFRAQHRHSGATAGQAFRLDGTE